MDIKKAKARVTQLQKELNYHNQLYYNDGTQAISDGEYDSLMNELKRIEELHPSLITDDSPTQRVGGTALKEFKQISHPVRMLSIEDIHELKEEEIISTDTNSEHNLIEWHKKTLKTLPSDQELFTVEPKIDGVAVSIMYERSKLQYAATRGDGETGDDITQNILTINTIPTSLPNNAPSTFEIRGEVFMQNEAFEELNKIRSKEGKTQFINPRNATAGTLKQLDPNVVSKRPIEVIFHSFGLIDGYDLKTIEQYRKFLMEMNLPVDKWFRIIKSSAQLRTAVLELDSDRHSFPYGTDGAVIKVNQIEAHESLGSTSKFPKWACAYKYRPEQGQTILNGVTIQVGRTGVLTPVAELDPIFISGTTVSRATLHNQDEIDRKDIRIGDTVIIEKSGEIIPAVIKVNVDKRKQTAIRFDLYTHVNGKCPSCNSSISKDDGFTAWRCNDPNCPDQIMAKLKHFGGRKMLELEGLGISVAEKLVTSGLVRNPLDLFDLKAEQLAEMELDPAKLHSGATSKPRRLGQKKALKLTQSIQSAKDLPLARWLHALGIPNLGESASKECARTHRSFDEISNSSILELISERWEKENWVKNNPVKSKNITNDTSSSIDRSEQSKQFKNRIIEINELLQNYRISSELGGVACRSLITYLNTEPGKSALNKLKGLDISPSSTNYAPIPSLEETESLPLSKTTWVITGTLSESRSYFKSLIETNGGNVTGSISKKTNYLLAGNNPGSKLEKANKLSIEVITESKLTGLISGN
ncbi:NAD-dependent DNA ligase LigA [Verrucomicrobiales bacterium]|nr:NAD-dependent DNA ligase LigA [Verrucomicrobiales bacterium]MDB4737309.1 NAD-dependent DNA ligase LigA [Verrucomicrobiales bacterium]